MRNATALALAILLLAPAGLTAQAADHPNSLTLFGTFGYVRNVSKFDVPIPGINQDGVAGSIRVMWHPEYLLSGGLEVGKSHVYSVEQTLSDGSHLHSTLDIVPILFIFSMSPWHRVHLSIGGGPTISKSTATSLGNTASSSAVGASIMASIIYLVPLSGKLGIGGEFRFLRTTKYEDNNLSLSVTLAYRFLH
jgi:hypothetical protein